ncbi:MAG: putative inorganic carbon transporter subunit DabA [Isosphaeraceae bacterium]
MESPTDSHEPAGGHGGQPASTADRLVALIEHAAHLLPAQGPITVFVHHNTLHAFEDLPFDEAVRKGAHVFGCHPYLTEDRYRAKLVRGRIRVDELREVLEQDLGEAADEPVPAFGTRIDLRMAMLQYPLRAGPASELAWYVAETDALRRVREEASSAVRMRLLAETRRWAMRDLRRGADPLRNGGGNGRGQIPAGLAELLRRFGESRIESWTDDEWEGFTLQALWRLCCDGVRDLPPPAAGAEPIRHRDLLLEAAGVDPDGPVHEILIRFCAAFLDQGLAQWRLPGRDDGFYRSFLNLYRHPPALPVEWLRSLAVELSRLADSGLGPRESIEESLGLLGVAEDQWEAYLSATLLAAAGLGDAPADRDPGRSRRPPGPRRHARRIPGDPPGAGPAVDRPCGRAGDRLSRPLAGLRTVLLGRISGRADAGVEPRAFAIFQLAQVAGVAPDALYRMDPAGWARLVAEVESFTSLERRRVFHLAYERRFYTQTLDAIALHARRTPGGGGEAAAPPGPPRFQAIFCIDEREESTRRHLEELSPGVETFGTAGFFSVPMYFRGVEDAHTCRSARR